MNSVIDCIFKILSFVLVYHSFSWTYSTVRREALLAVQRGLPSLETFTEKLTHSGGHNRKRLGAHFRSN